MSATLEIHIVSFTIPYPPDYGGVIDVFYKIKALYDLNVKINLHCFKYDREESEELEKYCQNVYYYPRPKTLRAYFSQIPFIVITRKNKDLQKRLIADNNPVLFEGLHSTYLINRLLKNNRKIIVRTHNIEHEYYKHLARSEKHILKKLFFFTEALKLKRYEKVLKSNIQIAPISKNDQDYFRKLNHNTFLIEAFHPFNDLKILSGKGSYILFHGNLSVHENIEAAKYIARRICHYVDFKFIIAGKNPNKGLQNELAKHKNIELIANPVESEMYDLIQNAHIHLLLTNQPTGIKLKLIYALHNGRFCIANNNMVSGSGLAPLCHIHNHESDIIKSINDLIERSFSEEEINKRREFLLKNVNNKQGAQKLVNLLYKN